ncbi:MAG TPA: aromatic ring-hydroxylating dioxygenase subunit alpha [Thiomonas arsenitoxydans]|uniref:aromatic ring-hydroxylating dioxygenase subunit alpha n=1 Tax=Thiomonas arsenitoxydans (strain DSM 22701 / CIP 110005 / 3As) TaxID=426114 RepID=UPI002B5626EF|nr:aromatic ring-hydroxylating dioxygenase subunit alpha [Thiomonas arsenitoxydans]HML83239.1 aromatic ring-hydroxylating dioxygenase subunit alpha [Thiomonas arsenitoxydans]
MERSLLHDEVGRRLNSGLHNFWYPVLPSWRLHSSPYGITRLSQRIVLWRDEGGEVHALDDRCPHRGAPLSRGRNLGSRIACWYHGIEVGGDGSIGSVPAVNGCPLEGRHLVRSYPVQEIAGAIFLWFGETDAQPSELHLPDEISDSSNSYFLSAFHWACSYRYAIDNLMDPMHGSYLHAVSHSMSKGLRQATILASETDAGVMVERDNQKGVNFDWVEFGTSGMMWLRLDLPYAERYGPGGPFRIIGVMTPIDEHHCFVFQWRLRQVDGWERDVWRFLYRVRLEGLHWDVLEQDRAILESMSDDAREHEHLYQNDIGLVKVRKRLQAMAVAEIEAEQSTGTR